MTHDQREAFEMATQVVVMNEGRIAQQGPPEEVRTRPCGGVCSGVSGRMNPKHGVTTIDCDYVFPRSRPHFSRHGRRPRGISSKTRPPTRSRVSSTALTRAGKKPENVEFLIVTHVHLDHAGGTSALLEHCPRATVLAHPRAARHLIDPSKLEGAARQVYGDAIFEKLYGRLAPIPSARVREMEDGASLRLGSRELRFIHTRGHANHHFSSTTRVRRILTGDSFGLAYPALQHKGHFIFPTTSPTHFDPLEAKASLDKILATGAERAFLTHFGEIGNLPEAARQLREHLDFSEKLLEEATRSAEPDAALPTLLRGSPARLLQNDTERARTRRKGNLGFIEI